MPITIKDTVFYIEDTSLEKCPSMFSPETFERTYDVYMELLKKNGTTPLVEYVFDKVETYVISSTKNEIKAQIQLENRIHFDDWELEAMAAEAAEAVHTNLHDGVYNEVVSVLEYRNLAYRSNSLPDTLYGGGVFNSPQVCVFERGWRR